MRPAFCVLLAVLLSISLTDPLAAQSPLDQLSAGAYAAEIARAEQEAEEGRALLAAGDHAAGIALLRPLAEDGNPVAQGYLGLVMTDPSGARGPYDPAEGLRHLTAAAEQGFGEAMHNLAIALGQDHPGFARDIGASSRWFIAAAERGVSPSFFDAGHALVNGRGVEQDIAAGLAWLGHALDGPDRGRALWVFGDLAHRGVGQDRDLARALNYYRLAAEAGDAYSAHVAGTLHFWGEGTPVDRAAALSLFEQAVEGDVDEAFAYLAILLRNGVPGRDPDPEAALVAAMEGDARGDGYAAGILGDFHRTGVGTPVDFGLARDAYLRGEARGEASAIFQLGALAYYGQGQPQDHLEAIRYYEAALAIFPDYALPLYALAYMRMRGEGGVVDIAGATAMLERAIDQRFRVAMVEGVELYGSPEYQGPQTDPVRAQAHCLYLDSVGWPARGYGNIDDHRATCARLAVALSPEDQSRAATQAASLIDGG